MRKVISLLAVAGLVVGLGATARAGKPATVIEDPAGDADNGQGLGASIPGGFDITSATIVKKGANIEFTVFQADMPPTGSLPETFRFLWAFAVDDVTYRWSIKSADIGKPDVAQGQTTERVGRVDLNGQFRLEGECGTVPDPAGVTSFVNCKPLGYVDGSFDPAGMSFTAIVPMKLIEAKVGSIIGPGAGDATGICASTACWVSHAAERSNSGTVIDSALQGVTYKVPKK